jgi:hypothetical protein
MLEPGVSRTAAPQASNAPPGFEAARLSARFCFSVFCGCFFPSFFGFCDPFISPLRLSRARDHHTDGAYLRLTVHTSGRPELPRSDPLSRDRRRQIRSGQYTPVVVLKLADRVLLLFRRAPKNADDLAAEQEAKRVWDTHVFHKSTGELTAVPKTDPRNW